VLNTKFFEREEFFAKVERSGKGLSRSQRVFLRCRKSNEQE
jgi:hypothetical protein